MKNTSSSKKQMREEMETRRSGFFFTGLIAATAFTLVAFEYQGGSYFKEYALNGVETDLLPTERINPIPNPQPKPAPEKPQPQTVIPTVVVDIVTTTDNTIETDESKDLVIEPVVVSGGGDGIDIDDSVIHEYWEEDPQFPGGSDAMYAYLSKNTVFPVEMKKMGASDKVYVSFVIDVDGTVSQVEAVRGRYNAAKKESVRVVEGMPKWIPATVKDKPVKIRFTLPIAYIAK